MGGRGDGQAVCCGASKETDIVRGLGIVDPRLAEVFSATLFAHLESPKVLVLDGWNEGRGECGMLTLVKETPTSVEAAGHGEQMRTVPSHITVQRFAVLSVPSSDDCGSHRPRCPIPSLGHQLNLRVRNTCPIVQILHCLDPISMC
jgi:hypothetical protein